MERPPKKSTAREITEAAVVGAAGALPIVGSPIATALGLALGWAYSKRMQQWLEELADEIEELQDRVEGAPSIEELAANDSFLDAVVNASRAAQATHDADKLAALRHAVVNSLAPDAPSADEQARFFHLIDQFTPSHLRLLAFLDDPGAVFDATGAARPSIYSGSRSQLLERAVPEFAGRRDWYDLLMADLTSAHLTNSGGLQVMQTGSSLWEPATSNLGKRFLAFVTVSS